MGLPAGPAAKKPLRETLDYRCNPKGTAEMGFSSSVRVDALVRAARHCCVCRRYKGVKVEIHHIVPQSQGGSNDLDNAIALCFDCHTDAGHYNPQHPRGTKFSRAELRTARDRWYKRVASGLVGSREEVSTSLQTRYLLCRNFNVLQEIAARDLSRFPIERGLLVETPAWRHLVDVIGGVDATYHRTQVWGDSYPDDEAYTAAHPDAQVLKRDGGSYPYFKALRDVKRSEITERVAAKDPVTAAMLRTPLPMDRICRALTYYEYCGDNRVQEIYVLRQVWLALLVVENVGSEPVTLDSILVREVDFGPDQVGRFSVPPVEPRTVPCPAAPVGPGETVVVPIATVLPGFSVTPSDQYAARVEEFDVALTQAMYKTAFTDADAEGFEVWGPAWYPSELSYRVGQDLRSEALHDLDLQNVYTVDRTWAIGSCPHAFVRFADRSVYLRELFALAPRLWQDESVVFPEAALALEIVELEDEYSLLAGECLGTTGVVRLEKGESLQIPAAAGPVLQLTGAYFPVHERAAQPDAVLRNQLVRAWLTAQEAGARRSRPA